MAKTKLFSERELFKPEPEPPEQWSILEHFKDEKVSEQKFCLPTKIYVAIKDRSDLDKFLQQALLDLIQSCAGLKRTEEELPRESWYSTATRTPTHARYTLKKGSGTISPYITVTSSIERKFIPIPDEQNLIRTHATDIRRSCGQFTLPNRLWNEAVRCSTYWQLTMDDFMHQAVERRLYAEAATRPHPSTNQQLYKSKLDASARIDEKNTRIAARVAEVKANRQAKMEE